MARVTTRTGDDGYTDLLGPGRVPKYHPRPETYGTIDEASSALGLARALIVEAEVKQLLLGFQRQLYIMMAELATPAEVYDKVDFKVRGEDVAELDAVGEQFRARVEIGKEFIVPGASSGGAALDLARTVIRRGERQVARLLDDGEIGNREVLRYLNRLSDVVFILARYLERPEQGSD